ncbi:MAG TPA: PAS domain S-box protein, partial [Micromonosporaceae bacterium]|nr:PAS domain S-box protein [Micromonosporaceae bacterium]
MGKSRPFGHARLRARPNTIGTTRTRCLPYAVEKIQHGVASRGGSGLNGSADDTSAQAEARFRALFADAAVAMGICDVKGQIVNVNQAMADMLGYSMDELCQLNVQTFAHPFDAADTWVSFGLIARGE